MVWELWLSFWKVLLSPQSSTEELWCSVSDHWVLGHLPSLLPWLLSLAKRTTLGRVMVVPNFFHLRMMQDTFVVGDLQCCRNVLVPFPRSVPRHNPVSMLSLINNYEDSYAFCMAFYRSVNHLPKSITAFETLFLISVRLLTFSWSSSAMLD
jgi:hypothetical protein